MTVVIMSCDNDECRCSQAYPCDIETIGLACKNHMTLETHERIARGVSIGGSGGAEGERDGCSGRP
jgi:hypothetical protein